MQNYFSKVFGIKFNDTLADQALFVFWFLAHMYGIAFLIVMAVLYLSK